MIRIGIIIGSTRPGRKAEAVAKWAYDIARNRKDGEFELGERPVDVKADREGLHVALEADVPVAVEPHPRRRLAQPLREAPIEDVLGDLDVIVGRDDGQARR